MRDRRNRHRGVGPERRDREPGGHRPRSKREPHRRCRRQRRRDGDWRHAGWTDRNRWQLRMAAAAAGPLRGARGTDRIPHHHERGGPARGRRAAAHRALLAARRSQRCRDGRRVGIANDRQRHLAGRRGASGPRAAAQRQELPEAGRAGAGCRRLLLEPGLQRRTQDHEQLPARRHQLDRSARIAGPRRQRRRRPVLRRQPQSGVDRGDSRVSRDLLECRRHVRPRLRRPDLDRDQVRHERSARLGVLLSSQRRARCPQLLQSRSVLRRGRPREGPAVQAAPVRGNRGRPAESEPALLFRQRRGLPSPAPADQRQFHRAERRAHRTDPRRSRGASTARTTSIAASFRPPGIPMASSSRSTPRKPSASGFSPRAFPRRRSMATWPTAKPGRFGSAACGARTSIRATACSAPTTA